VESQPSRAPTVPDTGIESHDVALVHDYLLVLRGAERTFAAIADLWPGADVFTTLYDAAATEDRFAGHAVTTSALQRLPIRQDGFRALLPLLPFAASRLNVSGHRVVVSSSSAFAHGVHPDPGAVHVCYCHTPFRYAWFERERALSEVPGPVRPVLAGTLSAIRRWDRGAARRVTRYVANSAFTRRRIRELYGRDAEIVHPPVDVDRFEPGPSEDYLLLVSEVVAHKRIDLAAEAAQAAGRRLRVVGGGPELERLQARYRATEFVGRVDDTRLRDLYRHAAAVVVPNVEEFGIVAVEAQAAGKPVVAARAGGAIETVVEGVTGTFVAPDDARELERALRAFDPDAFDATVIRAHAQQFSTAAFQTRMAEQVRAAMGR
jgi:glycosyltransferase involved in cell wall biosynthesis